jgi:chemotaxis protein CheD
MSVDRAHSFYDRLHERQVQRILAGEFLAMTAGDSKHSGAGMMMTVLGSCVAVCMTDVESKTAGMNHFMLPDSAKNSLGDGSEIFNPSARYGAYAMELLINEMMRLGATRSRIQAWIFGGARVLAGLSDIGQSNVDFAKKYLSAEKIAIAAQNTGGSLPRKLYLDPQICIPACITIGKITPKFNRDEQDYLQRVSQPKVSPRTDISLFSDVGL